MDENTISPMVNQDKLHQTVWELKEWRKLQEELQSKINDLTAELEASPTYQELQLLKATLKNYAELEADTRSDFLALGMILFDGTNKHPLKGVQVKEFKTVQVTDRKSALTWASLNCPDAVELKERVLAKAVELLDVSFVQKSSEFRPNLVEKELAEYE